MARTPLNNLNLVERIKQAAMSQAQPIIVKNSNDVTATIYAASTGATTLTNSFSLSASPSMFTAGLPGYLDPGEYKFTCGGAVPQDFDTGAGDLAAGGSGQNAQVDGSLSACNFVNGWYGINSVAATTTSQTLRLIRIVPTQRIAVVSIVSVSGSTAVAA